MSESLRFQGRALKAEQCSPDERHAERADRLAGDPRCEGRATDAEKHRTRRSHPALSHKWPGEPRTSSIVCGRQKNVYAVAIALGEIQRHVLLRKEVIQPHLPIRLPCYDFVPLT
jgi:hypothetical protein